MSKFIGIVSAYAYAVSQGYTGTEEEYAELMASYATVAEETAESAESAQASATTANSAASTATNKASEATTAAQTATDKAGEAQQSAQTATVKAGEAAQSASAAAESARTLTIDDTLTQSGQAADAKAVGDEIADLKSALNSLADDGEIPVQGNVHNYYFGGGPNYATVTPSSATRTMVFPIEDGANYQVKIVGNVFNVGYANEEYTSTGTLVNNTSGNPSEFDFTNTAGYGYLYVNYYNTNLTPVENPGVSCSKISSLITKGQFSELNDIVLPGEEITIGEILDGYVAAYTLIPISSTTLKHTNKLPVLGGASITITNYASVGAGGIVALFFRDDGTGCYTEKDGVSGGNIGTRAVNVPTDAAFVVFNCKPGTATPSISYNDTRYGWSRADYILDSLEDKAQKNFMRLFSTATQKPLCCIIDDDTMTVSDVEAFASLMETNGIRGTLATLTKKWETESGIEAKLHELETRGHQVVLHGYAQISAYKDAVAFDDANYKLAEADFAKGLSDMLSSGFCNPKYWVTPYGVSQNCMQRLAKKWGMKCLVTTAKTEYNGTDGKYTRWELQRSGLNPADTGALSYQGLLDLADSCAANNGWLIVNTHIYDWTNGYDRINDFITHCKNKGFEFLTLGEAMEIRWPVYNWYETF